MIPGCKVGKENWQVFLAGDVRRSEQSDSPTLTSRWNPHGVTPHTDDFRRCYFDGLELRIRALKYRRRLACLRRLGGCDIADVLSHAQAGTRTVSRRLRHGVPDVGLNMISLPDRTMIVEAVLYTLKGRQAGRFTAEIRTAH